MVADFHCECAEQEQRGKNYQGEAGARHVDESLDDMTETNLVRVLPDVVEVQSLEREEPAVRAVEILDFIREFQVVLFLIAGIEIRFENRPLGIDAERLDEARVVELVQDFLADGFESRKVGIQKDDAEPAAIGQIAQDIDESEVREHREDADAPCIFDSPARAAPAEEVVLVGIHLDIQERLASAVRT